MTSNTRLPELPRIAVFAKAPVAGAVKTRLIPLLGAEGAARLHASLARHALATAREAHPAVLQLWCSPDASHPFFSECAACFSCELHTQQGADLGARMAHTFARHAPLVLIGGDCPVLRPSHLVQAWHALQSNDAVFVPAEDGGYVLVGLARPASAVFGDIEWGGVDVMRETRRRIAAAGLECAELETLWDVDRPEDYRRMKEAGIAAEVQA
jgi:rSAM/selenodomain-associated transferase 1